jgi:hypothetical protein
VPLGEFLHEPATGAPQAAFSAVVASLPRLVDAGLLPYPGTALDRGLGSPEGRRYEADLGLTEDAGRPAERDVWDEVVSAAEAGYLDIGDSLGFLPGSGG